MKRRSVNGCVNRSTKGQQVNRSVSTVELLHLQLIATQALGIERGVIFAGRASHSINTEQYVISVAPTGHDPSTGCFSTPNVINVHESLEKLCDWSPCESLSSDHRSITITQPASRTAKGTKTTRLGLGETELKTRYFRSVRAERWKWTRCMRA